MLAVALGLFVIAYLLWKDFGSYDLSVIRLDGRMAMGIGLAVVCFALQNFGMMWRYLSLTRGFLSWGQVFRVNVLCEFTSAVTPSSVGGSSLIFLYLYKEGMTPGKSTAIMIASLFLDELFLFLCCLLVVCFFSARHIVWPSGMVH